MSFDNLYAELNRQIQNNTDLVRQLYKVARREGLMRSINRTRYFSMGDYNGIPVGLDLYITHVVRDFPNILAKMRILYEVSGGEADLSRVYARLQNNLGIVSEDMTKGGTATITDITPMRRLNNKLLEEVFPEEIETELRRTTFSAEDKFGAMRFPIVDLDHVEVGPKYRRLYEKYQQQYEKDERFIIREI